jgi:transcriptional regulator with XRE-family HTH domain
MAKVAEAAGVQRETIYRMLSETGNPRLSSLWDLFPALGLRISFEPIFESPERQSGTSSAIDAAIKKALGQERAEGEPGGITNIAKWKITHQQVGRGYSAQEQAGALPTKPPHSVSALEAFYARKGA